MQVGDELSNFQPAKVGALFFVSKYQVINSNAVSKQGNCCRAPYKPPKHFSFSHTSAFRISTTVFNVSCGAIFARTITTGTTTKGHRLICF